MSVFITHKHTTKDYGAIEVQFIGVYNTLTGAKNDLPKQYDFEFFISLWISEETKERSGDIFWYSIAEHVVKD